MSKRHLGYDEMLSLLFFISQKYPLKRITQELGVSRQTIYRLLTHYSRVELSTLKYIKSPFKNCIHISECRQSSSFKGCPSTCSKYDKYRCPLLIKFPYICNFCEKKAICRKERHFFHPEEAYQKLQAILHESHAKPHLSKQEMTRLNGWISPLIFDGKSVETIAAIHSSILPVSSRTVRNYINRGLLDVRRIDLRNAATRFYTKDYETKRNYSKNPLIKYHRTHQYFLVFRTQFPLIDVIEIDTVHGKKSDQKKLLTIHHVKSHFQFGILLPSLSIQAIEEAFHTLRGQLTESQYQKFFQLMLCDNGAEFDGLPMLEFDPMTGEKFARVFYTRPYQSGDKGACEKNHEFIRYIYKKGVSFESLTQTDINEVFSQINSYPRASLKFETPYDIMVKTFGASFLNHIHIRRVNFDDLVLKRK